VVYTTEKAYKFSILCGSFVRRLYKYPTVLSFSFISKREMVQTRKFDIIFKIMRHCQRIFNNRNNNLHKNIISI